MLHDLIDKGHQPPVNLNGITEGAIAINRQMPSYER